jgi:uncharacterized protein
MNDRETVVSANMEYAIIQTTTFGLFILFSISAVFSPNWEREYVFTNSSLINILSIEVFTGSIALIILKLRGWKASDFDLKFKYRHFFHGILLYLVTLASFHLTSYILAFFCPNFSVIFRRENVTAFVVLFTVIINPLFEEFFVTVYPSEVLAKHHGMFFTITLCAFVRFIYHLYQGPISITILILGIINTYTYLKWRKIWPLVIAHSINNYIAFTFY